MTGPLIEVGQAQTARVGERETGDRCVVKQSNRCSLVAVIDGVGHGHEAAVAAAAAAEVLERYRGEPLDGLFLLCHQQLRATRGAAITLTTIDADDGVLRWVGAGNVVAMVMHTAPSGNTETRELLVRSGVAGANLPSTEVSSTKLVRGDVLVLATDGVRPTFAHGIDRCARPQELAERLLADYGKEDDDALVVVARVLGSP